MTPKLSLPLLLLGLFAAGLATPASAQPASSFGGLQMQSDQPIAIESDQLDVDDRSSVATFSGNVSVEQGETRMRAERLIVHYTRGSDGEAQPAAAGAGNMPGGGSDISRIEASGSVEITSADQVATASQANVDMASQVVVMTGDVVLSQGANVATGCRLTVQMETGVAQLQSTNCPGSSSGSGGRVRMLLTPGSQN